MEYRNFVVVSKKNIFWTVILLAKMNGRANIVTNSNMNGQNENLKM